MMKIKFYILPLLVSALLLLGACGGSKTTTTITKIDSVKENKAPVNLGIYDFSIYDSLEVKLADGTLKIESAADKRLGGQYQVINQYVDNIPGLFNKSGAFEGQYSVEESKLFINMNPKIADANIFLNGTTYQDSVIGTWNYSTFRGPTNSGIFKAYYRK
jgi:hypothetical protein